MVKASKRFKFIIVILLIIVGFQFIFNLILLDKNGVLKHTLRLKEANIVTIHLYETIINDSELLRLQKFTYTNTDGSGHIDQYAWGFHEGELAVYERIAKILLRDP